MNSSIPLLPGFLKSVTHTTLTFLPFLIVRDALITDLSSEVVGFGASSTNVRECYKMKKKDSLSQKPPGEDRGSQMNLLWLKEEAFALVLVPAFLVGSFCFDVALGI